MKNLVFALMTFLLLLLWTSCDNNDLLDYTKVSGIVHDAGTGEPLANAKVNLVYTPNFFDNTASVSAPKDTFYTDNTGYYEFIYDDIRKGSYSVEAQKDGYWERNVQDNNGISPDKENEKDIGLYPFAWLKIHVKNVNPFDENDNIRYSGGWSGPGASDNFGKKIDFYDVIQLEGNKDIEIYWYVTKNDNQESFIDTINCVGGDTTLFEIFY